MAAQGGRCQSLTAGLPEQHTNLDAMFAACRYVREQLGYSHRQTVVCGDSGNDKDMLSGQNLAIVVGNAQPDLVAWLAEQKQESSNGHGQQRLFRAQQHMALGILEGLQQFGFK